MSAKKTSVAKMAFADPQGNIMEHPELEMLGWDGECWRDMYAGQQGVMGSA